MKRKRQEQIRLPTRKETSTVVAPESSGSRIHDSTYHAFTNDEIDSIRSNLLKWYGINKRSMPWRKEWDPNLSLQDRAQRAYEVWVSEIMLQQTQVSTVTKYYIKWMKKWPTVHDLAKADIESVNETWAGLGYYSRAKRLHESAKIVSIEYGGTLPSEAIELEKIGGIGKYTAGAISSIAYNEPSPLVDGNVLRVIARLRAIHADMKAKEVIEYFWDLAKTILPDDKPGDFNQALMELGATLCMPQNPRCKECPVKSDCIAYKEVKSAEKSMAQALFAKKKQASVQSNDIEECELCLPLSKGKHDVTLYPAKVIKKKAREEECAVCLVERRDNDNSYYLVVKRPETGLLAGLWEFPTAEIETDSNVKQRQDLATNYLVKKLELDLPSRMKRSEHGHVKHIFSHIHKTYFIEWLRYDDSSSKVSPDVRCKWVSASDIESGLIPMGTAMKKCWTIVADAR